MNSVLKAAALEYDRKRASVMGSCRSSGRPCLWALLALIVGAPCNAADGGPRPGLGIAVYFSIPIGALGAGAPHYGLRLAHTSADLERRRELLALRLSSAGSLRLQVAERLSWDFEERRFSLCTADQGRTALGLDCSP